MPGPAGVKAMFAPSPAAAAPAAAAASAAAAGMVIPGEELFKKDLSQVPDKPEGGSESSIIMATSYILEFFSDSWLSY